MRRLLTATMCLLLATLSAQAQFDNTKGHLSGSFETNTTYYLNDQELTDAMTWFGLNLPEVPDGRFGSNNYLKLDYTYGRLSVGLQLEGYLPCLMGYDLGDYGMGKKFMLANKYIKWQDRNFSFQVGDIYEQFGSGLVFRSFEDRALGFNNSLEGVLGTYSFNNYVTVKGIYGRPRLYDYYADSWIRGGDLSLSLNEMLQTYDFLLSLEGSFVNRYQNSDLKKQAEYITTTNTNLYSGRLNFDWNGLRISGEYVGKSDDLPELSHGKMEKGNAILAEVAYSSRGLALLGTFRRIEYMTTPLTYTTPDGAVSASELGSGNTLNYVPALTRQYTYLLTNLHPYQVYGLGEIGGQFDAFYSFRSKTNRMKRWNFHANFSTWYALPHTETGNGAYKKMWMDLNFDVERQWSKKLKTTFLYSWQQLNPDHGAKERPYNSHIFVYDMTYKFNSTHSLRGELQYLAGDDFDYGRDNEGDWFAALLEYNLAPSWSIYVSDMYNVDWTKLHYYNFGFSYTKGSTRIQLSYGRNKAGYICSGGVCRYTPAYTGFNLSITSSF